MDRLPYFIPRHIILSIDIYMNLNDNSLTSTLKSMKAYEYTLKYYYEMIELIKIIKIESKLPGMVEIPFELETV